MSRIGEHASGRPERGQVLVLFALALVAMISMVGLILDGSSAFSQRRAEQNAADLAALAGANAYMNTSGSVAVKTAAALASAQAAAARNGYTHGTDGVVVSIDVDLLSSGAEVRADVTKPHANTFARIVGMDTWDVSVTAASIAGSIDTAVGAAPWIMHIDAFNGDGSPKYGPGNPQSFGEPPGPNADYPLGPLDVSWTDFNGGNNVNANEVRGIIQGTNVVTATMTFDQYIGQHNNGMQTTIFTAINTHLAGTDVPVPVTGPCPGDPSNHGCFKGWAMFHVISASGGSNKTITGYFQPEGFIRQPLTVGECTAQMQAAGTCGVIGVGPFDNLVVRLSD